MSLTSLLQIYMLPNTTTVVPPGLCLCSTQAGLWVRHTQGTGVCAALLGHRAYICPRRADTTELAQGAVEGCGRLGAHAIHGGYRWVRDSWGEGARRAPQRPSCGCRACPPAAAPACPAARFAASPAAPHACDASPPPAFRASPAGKKTCGPARLPRRCHHTGSTPPAPAAVVSTLGSTPQNGCAIAGCLRILGCDRIECTTLTTCTGTPQDVWTHWVHLCHACA